MAAGPLRRRVGCAREGLKQIEARHVIVATVPQVTIAPIARGWRGKVRHGSRYFPYYIRPWIDDDDFDVDRDAHLTEDEARPIDSAIDAYNATIIASVRAARREGRDWYLFDLGGLLDSLATRRYLEDPAARPSWWKEYELPAELTALDPPPNTKFFRSGPGGRTDGGLFSLDGVHPTTISAGLIAREIIRIMNAHAQVPFFTQDGTSRAAEAIDVDFRRVLLSDTLISRPPTRRLLHAVTPRMARRDRRLGQPHAPIPLNRPQRVEPDSSARATADVGPFCKTWGLC